MAGRLYRMAKVVSANPKSWGIVDANEISGFKRVARLSDLYSIAECILSSSYGDGVTDGADAVGQIWHVSETNGDYKLTNWANRKSAAGWTKLSYGDDVSVPVKDVQVDGITVLSNGVANINLNSRLENYATTTITNDLSDKIAKKADKTTVTNLKDSVNSLSTNFNTFKNSKGQENGLATLDAHGYIPLDQLGNLDMTVFTVVESLPTSNIKNKVYLVRSSLTSDKNNYIEYIYTGDRKGTYDATKWEKLGEVAAKTDLSEYYKKSESYSAPQINAKVTALNNADIKSITSAIEVDEDDENNGTNSLHIKLTKNDTTKVLDLKLPNATAQSSGIMSKGYVSKIYEINTKLSGIETGANKTIVDSEFSATSTNPVQNKTISTWKNTTEKNIDSALRLIAANKSKLDTIDEHANNYSHPTHTAAAQGLYKVAVDSLGHVSHTTAVTKEDITKLGIPGSAPTVDTAMSSTSTNAVQNKVIDNAIRTHKVNKNNFSNIGDLNSSHTSLLFHSDDASSVNYIDSYNCCYSIFDVDDSNGVPKIAYSQDGGLSPMSYLLTDLDVVALSEKDVNNILNTPI